ncbi:MAG: helix-turn-helix transcriptional regulator [Pseudomonadota bacterium]
MNNRVSEVLVSLASRLKQARINHGITQVELAELIGMSVAAVKKSEKGECKLSTFIKIIVALNLDTKIDLFIPRVLPSPVLMDDAKTKKRKRASRRNKCVLDKEDIGW